ncbi:MAG: DUF6371 domain-containing protein [Candidatus Paceibacterota bacterium]
MRYKQPYLQRYTGKDSRKTCPKCGKSHSFTLYLDGDTNQPINPMVGICNHTNSCGYHYTPKQYFIDNPPTQVSREMVPVRPTAHRPPMMQAVPKATGLIPVEYMGRSQGTRSDFVQFLRDLFENINGLNQSIDEVCERYKIGSTKGGDVIFWQVDINGKVRTGKIMQYDPATGKRVHNASGAIDWVHNKLKRAGTVPQDFNLRQCYFGEHLLSSQPDSTIAIVESEKTAVIASVLMPQYIWIAAGNINGLTLDKSSALKGRSVILFPDLSKELPTRPTAFVQWSRRAAEIRRVYGCKVVVSDILERIATDEEKESGLDIADYLIRQIATSPQTIQQVPTPASQAPTPASQASPASQAPTMQEVINNEADELERWFNSTRLPNKAIAIARDYIVCEPDRYVRGAIRAIRSGKYDTAAHLERLGQLREAIKKRKLFNVSLTS